MRTLQDRHWTAGLWTPLCGILPPVILLCAYAAIGVYPFGDRSLLLVDLYSEYIEYFAHFHRAAREGGSLFRSWNMGMGLNSVGLIAFYTGSPLNLLLLLFPMDHLTEGVLVLTLVKVGLCGLSMSAYVRYAFGDQVPGALRFSAAVAYALSGYVLAYSSNIMWLDGVAFLPLVCLGVEKLLREGRCRFFALSLTYVFLSSYYIGYMIGIFSLLYFTAIYLQRPGSLRDYLTQLGRFLLGALTAAGLCAFLLLPAFLELRDGQVELWSIEVSWRLWPSLTRMAAKLLPGSYDSLMDAGLPNLYASVAGVVGATLFFTAAGIPRREKLAMGSFLGVMLLSLSCDILNLAWHAFEPPTWFPARYSFLVIFLTLHLALRGALAAAKGGGWAPALAGGMVALLFLEVGMQQFGFLSTGTVLLGMVLAAGYASLCVLLCKSGWKRGHRALVLALVPLLVCVELTFHTFGMVRGMHDQFGYRSRSAFYDYRSTYLPAVAWAEHNGSGAGRMEIVEQRNANGGMGLGYRGISHYSTTTDQTLNTLLRGLGYNTGTINEVRYTRNTPATNGLLGVEHVLTTGDLGEDYLLAGQVGAVNIYRNPLAFPTAFYADRQAGDIQLAVGENPFQFQNRLFGCLGAEDVFLPLQAEERTENLERMGGSGRIRYTRLNIAEPGILELVVQNPTGLPAYAFLPVSGRRNARATAFVDGEELGRELAYRANTLIPLGSAETAVLRLEIESGGYVQLRDIYIYALDAQAAWAATETAWAGAFAFERMKDTLVDGRITAPRDGLLATTFPYDEGWTVRVDGNKVPLSTYMGVFLAVEVPQGDHRVTMRYQPPGILPGAVVSGVTLAGCGIYLWKNRKLRRQ